MSFKFLLRCWADAVEKVGRGLQSLSTIVPTFDFYQSEKHLPPCKELVGLTVVAQAD